jgi:predicted HNH restriction endonuclease
MRNRIKEADIFLPALYIVYKNEGVNTTQIKEQLIEVFKPTGEDAELLSGRKDTKFTQIVRNLTGSHYETNEFRKSTRKRKNRFYLNELGKSLVEDNIDQLEYLFNNRFAYDDAIDFSNKVNKTSRKEKKLIIYTEDDIVIEGKETTKSTKSRIRSKKLRDAAIEYYKDDDGHIKCAACGFDFEKTYGELGKEFIQIHHEKPICQYSSNNVQKYIKDAIKDVKPLCANCHCMIHRNKNISLSVEDLKIHIK